MRHADVPVSPAEYVSRTPRNRWTGFANDDGHELNMTSVKVKCIAGLEPYLPVLWTAI